MVLNTDLSIAIKDDYGQYDIKKFSLFRLEKLNSGFSSLEVKVIRNKYVVFKLECPLCGEFHYYKYSINEFVKRKMIIDGCEKLGSPLFFIGNKPEVEQRINKHREVKKQIYAMI